ncbi:MAG: NAD(P)-dependent oxidoreductase [Microbacterium arborescens]
MTRSLAGRWIITVAAGTIGSDLRRRLHDRGVELVSIDIRRAEPAGRRDTVEICDVADLDGLTRLFGGADGVVHLGGIPDEADFHDLADVNIVGTYHVLEAARRAGVPRVVYASSNRLTGMHPASRTVSAATPPRPDGFYGVSKVAAEALCRLYDDKFDVASVAVRIGSYEQRPGSPREQRTWLSPDDAERAFVAAMTTDVRAAVFYAVSANRERWWDAGDGEAVGYHPVDDAAAFGSILPMDPDELQGGPYATREYSLARIRDER